jgi:hypothetical protein
MGLRCSRLTPQAGVLAGICATATAAPTRTIPKDFIVMDEESAERLCCR